MFKRIILEEKDIAKINSKPLLILIGEHHGQHYGSLVQAMIILISSFWANVNNLMLELDETRFNQKPGLLTDAVIKLTKYLKDDDDQDIFLGMRSLDKLSNELGGETHLIDGEGSANVGFMEWFKC